jgi:hypothetical protein
MSVVQAYRTLLRLYPIDFRALFALELQNAFEHAAGEHRLTARPVFIRFLLGEFIGLFTGAGAEWIAKLTTDSAVRGRCLPDLRMMRPPGVSRELWFTINPGPLSHTIFESEARHPYTTHQSAKNYDSATEQKRERLRD